MKITLICNCTLEEHGFAYYILEIVSIAVGLKWDKIYSYMGKKGFIYNYAQIIEITYIQPELHLLFSSLFIGMLIMSKSIAMIIILFQSRCFMFSEISSTWLLDYHDSLKNPKTDNCKKYFFK